MMKLKQWSLRLRHVALVCAAAFGLAAFGDYYEWTSSGKGYWEDSANWTQKTADFVDYRAGSPSAEIAFRSEVVETDINSVVIYNNTCAFSADQSSYGLKKENAGIFVSTWWNNGAVTLNIGIGTYEFGVVAVNEAGSGYSNATAALNLNNGTLTAGEIRLASGGTFTLNGGTLSTPSVSGAGEFAVGSNGGTIEAKNATTVVPQITGAGTLTKTGAGTLTFESTPASTVNFSLKSGTLVLPSDYAGTVASGVSGYKVSKSSDGTTFTLVESEDSAITWVGATDGNWSEPANWSGTVPSATDNVVFPDGASVTVDVDAIVAGITGEGSLTIKGPKALTVEGDVSVVGALTVVDVFLNVADYTITADALAMEASVIEGNNNPLPQQTKVVAKTIDAPISGSGAVQTTDGLLLDGATIFAGNMGASSITKTGDGIATVYGTNTINGSVEISAGTLKLGMPYEQGQGSINYDFDFSKATAGDFPSAFADASGSSVKLSASNSGTAPSIGQTDSFGAMNVAHSGNMVLTDSSHVNPATTFMVWKRNNTTVTGDWSTYPMRDSNTTGSGYKNTYVCHQNGKVKNAYSIRVKGSTWSTPQVISINGQPSSTSFYDKQVLTVSGDGWLYGTGSTARYGGIDCEIGEILSYNTKFTLDQRKAIEDFLMSKWDINETKYEVLSTAANVIIANEAILDLGGQSQTVASLAVSGAGVATVKNGTLTVTEPISLGEGQVLRVPAGSVFTKAEGVSESTANGVVTLTSASTSPAYIGETPYVSVQAAVDALVAGTASGTLKVYESATVTVSGAIDETAVEVAEGVSLTLNAIAPYSAQVADGKIVSVREAMTYAYIGPETFAATAGNFKLGDEITQIVPDSKDTVLFDSPTSINIGDTDIFYAAFVLNADVTVTGAGSHYLYVDGYMGSGKLILGDKGNISAVGVCIIQTPLVVQDGATAIIFVTAYWSDYRSQFIVSGALTGAGSLNINRSKNEGYSGITFSGDCSGFYGTIIENQQRFNGNAKRNSIIFSGSDFSNAAITLSRNNGDNNTNRRTFVLNNSGSTIKFGSLNGYAYGTATSAPDNVHGIIEIGNLGQNDVVTGDWMLNGSEIRLPLVRKVGTGTLTATVAHTYAYILNGGTLVVSSTDEKVPTTERGGLLVSAPVENTEDGTKAYSLIAPVTIPVVANATPVVKVGDVAYAADNGVYNLPADATVTIEWTADAGFAVTGGTTSFVAIEPAIFGATEGYDLPTVTQTTVTFSLPEVANADVTVANATKNQDGTYTATIGEEVTVVWTAKEGYVLSGASEVKFTAGADTTTVSAPEGMTVAQAVAQIGNDYYATLAEAVAQADAGDTVTLLADTGVDQTIVITKNLTIALGESKTVTANNCRAFWIKSGDVTISGTGTITTGENSSFGDSSSVIRVGDSATNNAAASLTIGEGVEVTTDYCYGVTAFGKNNGISLVVYGTVSVTGTAAAISGNGLSNATSITINDGAVVSATTDAGVYFPCPGTLTVTGGEITGPVGVYVKSGNIAISGGKITGTADKAEYKYNTNGLNATGDALVVDSCNYPGAAPQVSVTGGEFTSTSADAVASYQHGQSAVVENFVSGGTFNTPVALEYCATGKIPADNGSGSYGVEAGYVITWVVDDVETKMPVKAGVTPSYGENPTKANYEFKDWTPTVVAAAANATYTATWTANGVTLGTPAVAWGADFTNAVVSATVADGYDDVAYTLTYNSNVCDGTVENGKVTFNVPVAAADRYTDFGYTIDAKVGDSSVGSAKGSAIVADEKAWFSATTDGPTGGAWETTPAVKDGRMTFSESNTFTPTTPSSGKIVVIDMGYVTFGDTNDTAVNGAQAGIRIGESGKFVVLTTNNTWQETTVDASGTEEYHVVVTINYATRRYSVKVGDDTISDIPLAGSATKVSSIEFNGAGSLESLTGEYFEGAMVKDANGATYDTIEAAIAALEAGTATAPLTLLHPGTAPDGWTIEKGVLTQTSIVVASTDDKTLVAVPQGCTSIDNLIDLSNRFEGDQIQVYDSKTGKFNTWELSATKEWVGVGRQDKDDVPPVFPTDADKVLKAGQAVWVLRTTDDSKAAPIKLNATYAAADAKVEVAVTTGWTLVAPLPKTEAFDLDDLSVKGGSFSDGDMIVIPGAAAPINCVRKGDKWMVYTTTVEVKPDAPAGWGPIATGASWVDAPTVPAGKGFFFVSESEKTLEL